MAKRGIRKQDHEKLDDATVGRVVVQLEQDSPITKKAACDILNINYSTTRLAKIIEEYKENIEYAEKRKKQMKGQPFGNLELKDMVVSYLSGESIASIARRLFRSLHIVKAKLRSLNLPERAKTTDYTNPLMMPDEMVSWNFVDNEYVWSAKYNCVAQICEADRPEGCTVYGIYIYGKFMQFGYQPVEELGKLEILKQFKMRNDEFNTEQDFNYRIE